MNHALARLGEVSREYERRVGEYAAIAEEAARAEAEHVRLRARAFVAYRIQEGKAIGECERFAQADPEVVAAHDRRLVADAARDAAKQKLWQLQSQVEVGRSAAASERESDRFHSQGLGGAA